MEIIRSIENLNYPDIELVDYQLDIVPFAHKFFLSGQQEILTNTGLFLGSRLIRTWDGQVKRTDQNSDSQRVNNLTFKLTSPNGDEIYSSHGLTSAIFYYLCELRSCFKEESHPLFITLPKINQVHTFSGYQLSRLITLTYVDGLAIRFPLMINHPGISTAVDPKSALGRSPIYLTGLLTIPNVLRSQSFNFDQNWRFYQPITHSEIRLMVNSYLSKTGTYQPITDLNSTINLKLSKKFVKLLYLRTKKIKISGKTRKDPFPVID